MKYLHKINSNIRISVLALIFLVFAINIPATWGTALSELAAPMQPGTWAQLTTNGFNNGAILRPPATGSLLEYTDKAGSWNPLNQAVLVLGGSHPSGGPGGLSTMFVKYTESSNAWVNNLPNPVPNFDNSFGGTGIGHDYHHDTINPTTGDYYHRQYGSGNVMKFSHSSQSWSQCSAMGGNHQVAGALEYFPDRNSLVYLDGDWGVWELSLSSGNCLGTWVQRASTKNGGISPQLTGVASYSNQARYSSRCKCIIMGGGNGMRKLYRYNADGTFAAVADAPVTISIPQPYGDTSIFTIDPITGYILVWSNTNAATTMYQYDPAANTWTSINRASPIFPGPEGGVTQTIAVPISTYGIIMFVQAGSSAGGKVYLYKHSTGGASPQDTTLPAVSITSPGNSATVSSTTTITANASDNVGVAGVQFKLDGVSLEAEDTTLPYSISWNTATTSNGQHTLTATARDAVGNSATSSSVSVNVNNADSTPPKLLQQTDLVYQGSFRLPSGNFGSPSGGFAYGGTALSYNPAKNSLFIVGHDWDQLLAEVSIPTLINSNSISSLNTASVLQNFRDPTDGRKGEVNTYPTIKIGGTLVYDGKLIVTARGYYGANTQNGVSHGVSGLDMSASNDFKGWYALQNDKGIIAPRGFAGWIASIPPDWQASLGGTAFTGGCCVPGPQDQSNGPAAVVFNPLDFGVKNPVPALTEIYYNFPSNVLGGCETQFSSNNLYNCATVIAGALFPHGTKSVLFIGTQGTGPICYKNERGPSSCWGSGGYNAPPYVGYVWAYNAEDLVKVKNGQLQPWQVRPYQTWQLSMPFDSRVSGVAYDATSQKIYLTSGLVDGDRPVVHVLKVNALGSIITLPTITSTAASSITSSSAIITWTTNENSDTQVEYGTTTAYGSSTTLNTTLTASHKQSLNNLQSSTLYHYRVKSRDAAGYLAASGDFTITTSAAPSASDFATRCAASGVVKCVGFDQASDIQGGYGNSHGILSGSSTTPNLDASVKASGLSSLKFTIPSNSVANAAGSYFTNFADDLSQQFGENSEFYIQWRQRFSPELINTYYTNANGWKQIIIGTGDQPGTLYASCTDLETVVQNTFQRGFPQMYNSCSGSSYHGAFNPFEQPFGSSDFKLQNARPSPYCLYSQQQTRSYFPPQGNCFGYFPNEWMTFQVSIKTGPRVNDGFTNSYVKLWATREGQPAELVFDWGPYNLNAGSPGANQRFGKIWFLPYNTNKDPSQVHPTAYTWYDDLIISRNPIADPDGTAPAPTQSTTTSPTNANGVSVVGTPSIYSTIYSIGIELPLALAGQIGSDANHNAQATVQYRKIGTSSWISAMSLFRIDVPNTVTYAGDGSRIDRAYNMFAGSILFLDPATTYEVLVDILDPDGGSWRQTFTVNTRPVPSLPAGGRTFHVVPGTGGGDGSSSNPFRGIASAQAVARPGDIFLLRAGSYSGTTNFNKAGSPGNYIVWKPAGDGDITTANLQIGASFVWIEGFRGSSLSSSGSVEGAVITRNTLTGANFVMTLGSSDKDWYIADNILVGDKDIVANAGQNVGEGIELSFSSGHTIAHNRISNVADGVSYCRRNCDIFGNDIFSATDDGIEPDYGYSNIRMWGNRIYNVAYFGFSFQPQFAGPWYFVRNQVNFYRSAFKVGRPSSLYPLDHFVMVHNTFAGGGQYEGWLQLAARQMLRSYSRNNIWARTDQSPIWDNTGGGATWNTNLDYDGFEGGVPSWLAGLGQESHGMSITRDIFQNWNVPVTLSPAPPAPMLSLKSGASVINAGATIVNLNDPFVTDGRPDLGALEFGMSLPVYGPRKDGSISSTPTTGNVYYVSTSGGNDLNSCADARDINKPKKTFASAVSCLNSGDTLLFRQGTYAGPGINANNIPSGTSWNAATKLAAYPNEAVTWTAPNSNNHVIQLGDSGTHKYIIFDGLKLNAANTVDNNCGRIVGTGVSHIRFINFECTGATGQGFLTGGAGNLEFINGRIHHNGVNCPNLDHGLYITDDGNGLIENVEIDNQPCGFGIHFFAGRADNYTIRNNRIHNNFAAFYGGDMSNAKIYNNIIWGNQNGGLTHVFDNGGHIIANNIIYNNFNYPGIWIKASGVAGVGDTIVNNIVFKHSSSYGGGGIYIEPGTTRVTVRNNLAAQNTFGGSSSNYIDTSGTAVISGNLFGDQYDPKFVNAASNDYHLQSTSPAINTGVNLGTPYDKDLDGVSRPQGSAYDIGAYEFGGTVTPPPSTGNVYYVATNGNDANTCDQSKNINTPKKTFASAYSCLTPGATLYVRAGTYTGPLGAGMPSGTSWDTPITFKAYPGETVTIAAPATDRALTLQSGQHHLIFDGFIFDGAAQTGGYDVIKITSSAGVGAHHIRIQNSEIKNAGNQAILLTGKAQGTCCVEIINNTIHDNGRFYTCCALHGVYSSVDNLLIEGNDFYNFPSGSAIQLYYDSASNAVIRNNKIHGIHGRAPLTIGTGQGHKIYNNLLYAGGGLLHIAYGGSADVYNNVIIGYIDIEQTSAPPKIINNIIYCAVGACPFAIRVFPDIASTVVIKNNIIGPTVYDSLMIQTSGSPPIPPSSNIQNNLIGSQYDPRFVNAAAGDFHLQSTSPAINTGVTLGAQYDKDFEGVQRPVGTAYDIGAFEFGGTPTQSTTTGCPGFIIEGFGKGTTGGCGGPTTYVTSLANSGPGTLREALTLSRPRIIKFAVSGTIELTQDLGITGNDLTIDGSDAPNGGIAIKGATVTAMVTNNMIFRHIRFRTGPDVPNPGSGDSFRSSGTSIVLDHVSLSWSTDETISFTSGARGVTVQHSIISESLACTAHPECPHNLAALVQDATNVTFHHNLFAHHGGRIPGLLHNSAGTWLTELVNNFMYNSGGASNVLIGDPFKPAPKVQIDSIGNYFKKGPNSLWPEEWRRSHRGWAGDFTPSVYIYGNIDWGRTSDTQPQTNVMDGLSQHTIVSSPHVNPAQVTSTDAFTARDFVLANAGATLPCRDSVDRRVVNDAISGTGRFIDDPSEVGGWPDLSQPCSTVSTPAPTVSISANPSSITSGSSSTLSWSSTNAVTCTASGGWDGTKTASGTQSVSPTATTTYTLSCTGTGGTASQSATLTAANEFAIVFGVAQSSDATLPIVSITFPANSAIVSGTTTITANASDNVGVSKVEFYVDGALKSSDTSSPYSFAWDTTNGGAHACNGAHTHTLSAKAYDAANNIGTSSNIVVNMNNPAYCTTTTTGNVYYVATNGYDGNSCADAKDINKPKKTINAGISCLASGDTLLIRGGTYAESIYKAPIPNGISWNRATKIARYGNEVVILRPSAGCSRVLYLEGNPSNTPQYMIFDGLVIDAINCGSDAVKLGYQSGGDYPYTPHHIRIINSEIMNSNDMGILGCGASPDGSNTNYGGYCEIINNKIHDIGDGVGSPEHGVYITGPNNLFEGNEFYNIPKPGAPSNNNYGIHIWGGGGEHQDNNIVRYNKVHDVLQAMIISKGDNNQVYYNLVYNTGSGIAIHYFCANCKVFNNVIYKGGGIALGSGTYGSAVNTIVRNNIIYPSGGISDNGISTVQSNNLFADPKFVNAAALDFHLQSNSPAINSGTNVGLTRDFDGNSIVGAPDVGAYEYGGTVTLDTTTPSQISGLTATVASSTQINLAWNSATDNVGVAGYKIYRGGTQIATATTTSYSDSGLSASTSYSYAIAAYDAAGNTGAQSSSVSAATSAQTTTGNVYYVSTSGYDGNSCADAKDINKPKKTVGSGVACLSPGDILRVKPGVYTEGLRNNVPGGTSWSNPVTIQAYDQNNRPILRPTGDFVVLFSQTNRKFIVLDGLDLDGVSATANLAVLKITEGANNIRLKNSIVRNSNSGHGILITHGNAGGSNSNEIINNKIYDNGFPHSSPDEHGIYVRTSSNLIEGNEIYNNWGLGIHQYECENCAGNIYRKNIFHNNFAGGPLGIYDGSGTLIYNNLFYDNTGYGIDIKANGTRIYHNTLYKGVVGIWVQPAATNTIIKNNILYDHTSDLIRNDGTGTVTSNNLLADPLFVDAANRNLAIQSGSAAKNSGTTLTDVLTDYLGVTRPQGSAYDIGAYEYGGTVSQIPTITITATPSSITSGSSSTLTWSSSSATSCTAFEGWSGTKTVSGTQSVNPTATTTYTLSCTGTGGTASQSATVIVTSISTKSLSAKQALSAIALDGSLSESAWASASSVSFSNPAQSNNLVTVKALWDANNLYFAYNVTDSQLEALNVVTNLWQDDGAEIYLDEGHERSTIMDANDYHFFTNINNAISPSGFTAKTQTKAGGYTQEISIPWSLIGATPQANKVIGLLLANNDRDGGVSKQFDWANVISTGSYAQPNLWGDLVLSSVTVTGTNAPLISNTAASSITSSSAIITWNTNEMSTHQVDYGTTAAYGSSTTEDMNMMTSHSQSLSGLQANTLYHYRVKSRNAAGILASSQDFTFTTLQVMDTIPPTRSNGQPTGILPVGTTQATLSLTTNEAATCRYSTTGNRAYNSLTGTFATTGETTHSTALTGLEEGQTYNYYVRCIDSAGNVNANDYLINFSVAGPQSCAAQGGYVCAGGKICSGNGLTAGDTATCCSVPCTPPTGSACSQCGSGLFNLCDKTECYSIVQKCYFGGLNSCTACANARCENYADQQSCNDDHCGFANCTWSGTNCASRNVITPAILNVAAVNVSATKAIIAWDTNEASDSQVSYGTVTPPNLLSSKFTALTTKHTITLTNLQRKTTYYYRATSADVFGNSAASSVLSFATAGKPPKVRNLQASPGSVKLNWENPSLSEYEFFKGVFILRSENGFVNVFAPAAIVADTSGTSFTDTNVAEGRTYYYTVFAYDDLNVLSDPSFISFTSSGIQNPINIAFNTTDIDTVNLGLQVYGGGAVTYSAVYDTINQNVSWAWYYSTEGNAPVKYLSGTGAIQNVVFTYPVGHSIKYNWTLVINDSSVIYQNDLLVIVTGNGDKDNVPDTLDKCLNTPMGRVVNKFGCSLPKAIKFSSRLTTDFRNVDLTNFTRLIIGIDNIGKIDFGNNIIQLVNSSSEIPLDLDSIVELLPNKVIVRSELYRGLNLSAIVTLMNITNITNPVIKRDGVICDDCIISIFSDGNITFTVPHFSEYFVDEGSYCGDTYCSSAESCSSCSTDCGACPVVSTGSPGGSSGGGGGGGGSGGFNYVCNQDWVCSEWSTCIDGWQTRQCNFVRVPQHAQTMPCPEQSRLPATSRGCIAQAPVEVQQPTETQEPETTEPQPAESPEEGAPVTEIPEAEEERMPSKKLLAYLLGSLALVAIVITVFTILVKGGPKKPQRNATRGVTAQSGTAYIKRTREEGISDEKIREALLKAGWKKEAVDKLMKE